MIRFLCIYAISFQYSDPLESTFPTIGLGLTENLADQLRYLLDGEYGQSTSANNDWNARSTTKVETPIWQPAYSPCMTALAVQTRKQ